MVQEEVARAPGTNAPVASATGLEGRVVTFIKPFLLLLILSLAGFWGLFLLDLLVDPPLDERPTFSGLFQFAPPAVEAGELVGVVAAILGIVVTVVSIVVQLSASRFSGITRMFLRDSVNLWVVGYYVFTCVLGLWVSVGFLGGYMPKLTFLVMLSLDTIAIVLMVPYFGYVFAFLDPKNVIRTILGEALRAARQPGRRPDEIDKAKTQVVRAMEELTDIANGSIAGRDKIIASAAVDALAELVLGYLERKPKDDAWYRIDGDLAKNPDFVALDPESLVDLERKRLWLEWKVMRNYLGVYNEGLSGMKDVDYLIAIDTRYIGEAAARASDRELVSLVYRFLNSYLRATLNARDVRTAYNVLNQYRLLVESLVRLGCGEEALEGLSHMIYYGHVSFDMKLTFVTETVAHDVASVCQLAHAQALAVESTMLDRFLDLDRPLREGSQEQALVGVRRAQVKLAAYYLSRGEHGRAERIADDLRGEPEARLEGIFSGLRKATSREFWEITDRGRNFEYMPEAERAELDRFIALTRRSAHP
ncbi:MAG: hypothetical protein B6A08_04955 [Sorangiineae bacterium NIC37A_2]|nr:MAG: hypothetical protein B6A08_04955 [Sorangiineae bacterium NIC37A_2]